MHSLLPALFFPAVHGSPKQCIVSRKAETCLDKYSEQRLLERAQERRRQNDTQAQQKQLKVQLLGHNSETRTLRKAQPTNSATTGRSNALYANAMQSSPTPLFMSYLIAQIQMNLCNLVRLGHAAAPPRRMYASSGTSYRSAMLIYTNIGEPFHLRRSRVRRDCMLAGVF